MRLFDYFPGFTHVFKFISISLLDREKKNNWPVAATAQAPQTKSTAAPPRAQHVSAAVQLWPSYIDPRPVLFLFASGRAHLIGPDNLPFSAGVNKRQLNRRKFFQGGTGRGS